MLISLNFLWSYLGRSLYFDAVRKTSTPKINIEIVSNGINNSIVLFGLIIYWRDGLDFCGDHIKVRFYQP